MNIEQFEASLSGDAPALSPPLLAMWHASKGEWDEAHRIVQAEKDADAAWVHACLHRIQGDLRNARYWYGRAGRAEPEQSPEQERRAITSALLAGRTPDRAAPIAN